ncbi:MAG: pyridoxamine 5'-phosphate oxidase family protein [Nitrospinae bacterium]|nr:pyridoxamine 5'-phosphate oxidase family protein [Nitrospinota bacterium]
MTDNFTELAFTDSVKTLQEKYGTRTAYSRMERGGKFRNQLTWQEKKHIADRDGFYLASVGENGWPYMQFRGGPKGFLKVIDDHTLAFADFRGNGQYISTGNFIDNNKTMLFLMDYPNKRRLKIWAEAEVLDAADHPELAQQLIMPDYEAIVERIIVFKVHAFDWNCPQHITPRYSEEEIQNGMVKLDHESAGGA